MSDFVADLRAPTPTAAAELATPDQLELRASILELSERLARSIQSQLSNEHWSFSALNNRLIQHSPRTRLQTGRQRLDELTHRTSIGWAHFQQLQRAHLSALQQRLAALSPQGVLQRGYAIVTFASGRLIHSVQQTSPGDALTVRVTDGEFSVRVEKP
jgi:exodeoxyribonuclease VII large subunit